MCFFKIPFLFLFFCFFLIQSSFLRKVQNKNITKVNSSNAKNISTSFNNSNSPSCIVKRSDKTSHSFAKHICFLKKNKWFGTDTVFRQIHYYKKKKCVVTATKGKPKKENKHFWSSLENECKAEQRKTDVRDGGKIGERKKSWNTNTGVDENEKTKEETSNNDQKKLSRANEKRTIQRDEYGLPTELLSAQRLSNRNVKTKYGYYKIKKYRETININYKKKKILSIHEGSLKNKKILSPDIYTRPMMSVVKESLFSILKHLGVFNCYDMKVLDIFSGSGNLGIECISRNINTVSFVDLSLNSCKTIYENLKICNLLDENHLHTKIIRADAMELLQNPQKFHLTEKYDLGFFTPPYEQIIYSDLIHSISKCEIFQNDSLIYIEYPKEIELLPAKINNLIGLRNRKFGRTYFALYVLNCTGKYINEKREEEFYPLHYNRKQRRQHKFL